MGVAGKSTGAWSSCRWGAARVGFSMQQGLTGGVGRCVYIQNESLALQDAALAPANEGRVLVLVNDSRYGGCASTFAVSYNGSAEILQRVWIAARSSLREVFENVTLEALASRSLPESVEKLTLDEDAWQPH